MAAEIRVGAELQAMITAAQRVAPEAAGKALDGRLIEIVNEARAAWPVKTGASQRALRIRAARRADGVVVRIVQDLMPYAGAVHFKGEEGTTCAEELVFGPIEEALDDILEDFGDLIVAELERV